MEAGDEARESFVLGGGGVQHPDRDAGLLDPRRHRKHARGEALRARRLRLLPVRRPHPRHEALQRRREVVRCLHHERPAASASAARSTTRERTSRSRPTRTPNPDDKDPPATPNALDSCPGKSTAVQPDVDIKLEGDTSTATGDRKGRQGACAVGAGAGDHIYRLIPSGSGSLDVKVQGSDGLDPVAYVRTTCADEESQVSCGPPSANKLAQFKLNVTTGKEYYLVIDGASASAGKYVANLKLTTGSFCGDGKVDPNEACDDGNKVEDDGCSNDCKKVNGNPTSGGACPGHRVDVWTGQTVTGTGSTNSYGNAWNAPSQACDVNGTNNFQDHVYEVTPHATGNLVVTLSAPPVGALPNLMLAARRTCTSATSATANMCANNGGAGAGETMTFSVTKDTKVYVAVDGGGATNNKGDYSISFKLQ